MSAPNMPRMMAAGAIGNMLEWYDFAVYGYFATAIGRVFFPEQDKVGRCWRPSASSPSAS